MLSLMLFFTLHAAPAEQQDLEHVLAQCRKQYDLACVQNLLERLAPFHTDAAERLLSAQAHLLMAELYRIEYEATTPDQIMERRALGKQIDEAAEQGLEDLESLSENSNVLSLKADLLGTMIRTAYQAAKYRKRMIHLAEQALALDPENAQAWLALAKPYLFPPPGQGQDLPRAAHAIARAIQINGQLEAAHVLQALLLEKRGDNASAAGAWTSLLLENPNCLPAKLALESPVLPAQEMHLRRDKRR